jgi:hypothetical protein
MALGVKGNLRGDRIRIAISMPQQLFDRINIRALRKGCSFNAEANLLLSCGLFDYEESESLDPVSEMATARDNGDPEDTPVPQ